MIEGITNRNPDVLAHLKYRSSARAFTISAIGLPAARKLSYIDPS
jgi:hypothetical protein